jgi:hypothetical protein
MMEDPKPTRKLSEVLPERFMKKILESVGEVFDKKLGRKIEVSETSTATLIERMKSAINERVRNEGRKGLIAPHVMKVKMEWGKHAEAPPEVIAELEKEILAAAIDHINDNRYRTLDKVRTELVVDIFTSGVKIEPTFGEFEEDLSEENEERKTEQEKLSEQETSPDVKIVARVLQSAGAREVEMTFQPGGKRLSIGRGKDNHLFIDNTTVSKVHAAMVMNNDGVLLVADTGSTNGTFINGRRLAYGEAGPVEEGDVVSFGDVEVRFRKQ